MRHLSRLRLLVPGALLTLVACPGPMPVQSSISLYPDGCVVPEPRDQHWPVSAEAESLLVRSGYCNFHVAGIHDRQALAGDGDELGPVVQLFAAPNADSLTGDRAFEGDWVNVAILARDAGTAPAKYEELGLSRMLACVYLRRVPRFLQGRSWTALITDPIPDTSTTPARDSCPATQRDVDGTTLDVTPERPSTAPADYPVAARFTEVTVRGTPHTAIGFRCGNAWCLAGPAGQRIPPALANDPPPLGNVPAHARAVRGWGDEQALSVPSNTPGRPLRRTMRAAIVPSATLGQWTYDDFGQDRRHVATIRVQGAVPQKYVTTYSLRPGENEISLLRQDTTWTAWINGRSHRVERHEHPGTTIPAVARWTWHPADEQIWVRCDVGCCRVIEPS